MEKIKAKIVADSISPQGHRITSMLLTYPRFIHGEVMTHRVFSRNSASSRAIPFEKMVKMVEEDPFVPIAFQRNHKGMQGTEYLVGDDLEFARDRWNDAKNYALSCAEDLFYTGTTKQIVNRLLEPFMWHTTLITATEFSNFFELRCPKYEYYLESYGEEPEIREYFCSRKNMIAKLGDVYVKDLYQTRPRRKIKDFEDIHWYDCNLSQAEIHIQALAESMWDAMNESMPKQLKAGEWHIPFGDKIDDAELLNNVSTPEWLSKGVKLKGERIKIATARCARLSYMTHDGEIDYEKDIRLHDQLFKDRHLSPFEHCARAMSSDEYYSYHSGELADHTSTWEGYHPKGKKSLGWCNNFRGWIQYRYLIENT